MKCPFVIGQKVICVAPLDQKNATGEAFPEKGCIYTIAEFEDDGGEDVGLYLKEIINSPRWYQSRRTGKRRFCEVSWVHTAFRPLEERKTDISIFTSMLTPTPSKENVEA